MGLDSVKAKFVEMCSNYLNAPDILSKKNASDGETAVALFKCLSYITVLPPLIALITTGLFGRATPAPPNPEVTEKARSILSPKPEKQVEPANPDSIIKDYEDLIMKKTEELQKLNELTPPPNEAPLLDMRKKFISTSISKYQNVLNALKKNKMNK